MYICIQSSHFKYWYQGGHEEAGRWPAHRGRYSGQSLRHDLQEGLSTDLESLCNVVDQVLRANEIKQFVLDEADEMLSRGFKDQIYDVFRHLNQEIQVCDVRIFELTNVRSYLMSLIPSRSSCCLPPCPRRCSRLPPGS